MSKKVTQYLTDISRTPILGLTIIIISTIAILLDSPLIIPTFAASLFTLVILQHGHSVRVVIGSHLVAFALAASAPFLLAGLNFIPAVLLEPIVFGAIVFVASLVITITKLNHAPAIASTIVFFEAEKSGYLVLGAMPLNVTIAFAAGLIIVALTAKYVEKLNEKSFKEY